MVDVGLLQGSALVRLSFVKSTGYHGEKKLVRQPFRFVEDQFVNDIVLDTKDFSEK